VRRNSDVVSKKNMVISRISTYLSYDSIDKQKLTYHSSKRLCERSQWIGGHKLSSLAIAHGVLMRWHCFNIFVEYDKKNGMANQKESTAAAGATVRVE
jgi:dihydrofolate reductase